MAVEKFLADAHYNLLHWFDNKQHESEGMYKLFSKISLFIFKYYLCC